MVYPSAPAVLSWIMTLSSSSLILIEENSKQIFSWNRFLWQTLPHPLEKLCFKTNPIFSWHNARCPFISRPQILFVTLSLYHSSPPFSSFPVKVVAAYLTWKSWFGPIKPEGIFPAIEGIKLPFGPPPSSTQDLKYLICKSKTVEHNILTEFLAGHLGAEREMRVGFQSGDWSRQEGPMALHDPPVD